jgi:hypothetical protein
LLKENIERISGTFGTIIVSATGSQGPAMTGTEKGLELTDTLGGDELVVKANLKPSDISHVHEGQQALVRLSALNRRITPMVAGKVIYVSADALPEHSPFVSNISASSNLHRSGYGRA